MHGFTLPIIVRVKTRRRWGSVAPRATIPSSLDFGLAERRPLVPLPAVTLFLDRRPREILALIESGRLRWAFDIRTRNARAREIRVWRDSLLEFAGLKLRPQPPSGDQEEFDAMMSQMLPEQEEPPKPAPPPAGVVPLIHKFEPTVSGGDVARCLSCAQGHVVNLLRDRLLAPSSERVPQGRLLVTRSSVIEFLRRRRIL